MKTPSIDRGYAWVVLASCFVMRTFVMGVWGTIGIYMLEWEYYFDISASKTALLGSSFATLIFCSTPVSSALAYRFTPRSVAVGGGVTTCLCLIVISLLDNFWFICAIMPVLGFGFGLTFQIGSTAFICYFDKRYGIANGLTSAATGTGLFIFPPVMEILIAEYGWKGALQITAAVMGNICVCGYLLRPIKTINDGTNLNNKLEPRTFNKIAKRFDLPLYKRIPFLFYCVINGVLYGGLYAYYIYLYTHSVSVGISDLNSSFLISTTGICTLVMRIIPIGHLVDRQIIRAENLAGVAILICGITITATTFVTSYVGLVVVAVFYGAAYGVGGSINVMVIALSGGSKEDASGAIAWQYLYCGVGNLLAIYGCGYLYDKTGSYQIPLILCGSAVISLACILLANPIWQRWQTKLDNDKGTASKK